MSVWNIDVEGKTHTVEFREKGLRGRLFIDNIEERLKSRVPFFTLIDNTIWLGPKPVQLVIVGRKADVAVDGVFLTSGEPYRPVNRIPWFVWLFFFLCAFLGLLLADLAGLLVGLAGGYFCLRIAIAPDLPVTKQVLFCLGVFALCMLLHCGMHVIIARWMGEDGYQAEMELLQNMSEFTGSDIMPGK